MFGDAAIQACRTIKALFGVPLRRTTGFVASLLRLAGLDWPVPDCSTLCRRRRTLRVQLPYQGGRGPLNLLVDNEPSSAIGPRTMASGIKLRGEGEWHAREHGGARRRVRRKVHLGIDEATMEACAVESSPANAAGPKEPVDASHVGDAPGLLDQVPGGEAIASVTADGA